jgi:hypothetical protein
LRDVRKSSSLRSSKQPTFILSSKEKSALRTPKKFEDDDNYLSFEFGKVKASANGPLGVFLLALLVIALAIIASSFR